MIFLACVRYLLAFVWFGAYQERSSDGVKKQFVLVMVSAFSAYVWREGGFALMVSIYFFAVWILELVSGFLLRGKKRA